MRTTTLSRLLVLILATVLLTGCGGGPSGVYEATLPGGEGGTLTLDFDDDGKVKMTMAGMGISLSHDGTYTVDGDRVTISRPDGDSMVLVKKGGGYEATDGGETLVFKKK